MGITAVGADEKETGLIVDKLYQALLYLYSMCTDCLSNDIMDEIETVMKEFEDNMVDRIGKVIWKDSGLHIDYRWAKLEKYMADASPFLSQVETVGVVMHEDDDIIMLGMSYDAAHDTWYGAQVILKQNVIDIYKLEYPI